MDTAKKIVDTTAAAGMGQTPIEMGHPIHPATVHWPIAFWSASFGLDIAQHFVPGIFVQTTRGSLLSTIIPPASTVSALSHYANAAGIGFAAISIATGLSELYGMWKAQAEKRGGWMVALKDAYTAPSDDIGATKLKTTLTHASMNDAVTGIAVYNFYKRAQSPTLALPTTNAYLSLAMLPLLMYSAMLGGKLVYELGVGVMRQGEGLEVKKTLEKQQKEL